MVHFIGPDNDAYVASVIRRIAEYEELSGEKVELEVIPETRLRHQLPRRAAGPPAG